MYYENHRLPRSSEKVGCCAIVTGASDVFTEGVVLKKTTDATKPL